MEGLDEHVNLRIYLTSIALDACREYLSTLSIWLAVVQSPVVVCAVN